MKKLLMIAILTLGAGCSATHVDDIKAHAEKTWSDAGYDILGYEGYQYGSFGTWGGQVWYIIKRHGDVHGITYHGFISKWGDEYHIYNLQAIDAITPNNQQQ